MFKRTRDVKRKLNFHNHITYEQWQSVLERYTYAKNFMKDTNHLYVLLCDDLREAENIVLENRVHEVRDEHQITDTLKKVFITKEKVQVDEVIGQIKYLRGLLGELQIWVDNKEQLEKDEADGKITIDKDGRQEAK